MRISLPGNDPRVECLKKLAIESGHELTECVADAEVLLCCQLLQEEGGAVFRHTTLELLQRISRDINGPLTVCFVSFEPNFAWTAGFCHCGDTTLRMNSRHPWHMTRAHVRAPMPGRSSELILGADCDEAAETLLAVWEPMTDVQPLSVEKVFVAELAAESVVSA